MSLVRQPHVNSYVEWRDDDRPDLRLIADYDLLTPRTVYRLIAADGRTAVAAGPPESMPDDELRAQVFLPLLRALTENG